MSQEEYLRQRQELEARFKHQQRQADDDYHFARYEMQQYRRMLEDWLVDYHRAKEDQDAVKLAQLLRDKPEGITLDEDQP